MHERKAQETRSSEFNCVQCWEAINTYPQIDYFSTACTEMPPDQRQKNKYILFGDFEYIAMNILVHKKNCYRKLTRNIAIEK